MSRRPSISIHDYPEDLNPFKDGNEEPVLRNSNHLPDKAEKEDRKKFWTFGRSKKKRSNSFSIKSTWNGIFGKKREEATDRKPTISTVSSTYQRASYNDYSVQPARPSNDQQEFTEAFGTLARRRKYAWDNSSRYSSSLTVNGDPGRIYEGVPQDTTQSIMGDLTPKPPVRRFGQVSPKLHGEIPPLDYGNGSDDKTPVPPKRGGIRSSQLRLAAPSSPENDNLTAGNTSLTDENENVPGDYVFKRSSHDAVRKSNLSINSCISMSSVYQSGRKKRRAPPPPERKTENPITVSTERDSIPQAEESTQVVMEKNKSSDVEVVEIAKVTEDIDQMTKKTQEIDNIESVQIHENGDDRNSYEDVENVKKLDDHDKKSVEIIENVEIELRRNSEDPIEIIKDVETIDIIDNDDDDVILRKKSSQNSLVRSDSFSVKEEIEKIEKQIKRLEARKPRSRTCSFTEIAETIVPIFERGGSRRSLQETRKNFFREMTKNSGDKVTIEIKELPKKQNDIEIIRLSDPPIVDESSKKPIKIIELHISEPIRQTSEFSSDLGTNPIPKPRRQGSLHLDKSPSSTEKLQHNNGKENGADSPNLFRPTDVSFERRRRTPGFHSCELERRSQSTLPRLPPTARISARLKRSFQKLIIVSEDHPYTKVYLRSRAAVALEKKRHGRSKHWWVIHPCSKFRFYWDNLMMMIFLHFFIGVPYFKAFHRICGRGGDDLSKFIHPIYIFCILDIAMSFVTGYVSQGGSEIFLIPGLIARNYTQGFFLLDLLTSVPYNWFTSGDLDPPSSEVNFLAVIAELVPLLKMFRMPTLRHYVKQASIACGLSSVAEIVLWFSLLTILIFHWSACLTWAFPFLVLYATQKNIINSDSYIVNSGVYQEDSGYIYLISLHMGVSNLVGSSLIEFKDTSMYDKLIRCIILLFGTGYTIYLIVVFLQLVESSTEHQLKYQEVMNKVQEYIEDKNLPDSLRDRLIEHYEYRFQGSYFKENTIVSTLSSHLKQEITALSYRDLLENSQILHNLPKSLLTNIMNVVEAIIYHKNDTVYKIGDDPDCMYFIASGTVAIVNFVGKEIAHLEDGDHFGEISLIHPERKREISVIAEETCELLLFHRRYFSRLVPPDSELYRRFSRIVTYRLDQVAIANKLSEEEEQLKNQKKAEYRKVLLKTSDVKVHV